MALPLILRNCCARQGVSTFLKLGNFSQNSRKIFSQVSNQTKTLNILNSKVPNFNVTKREMSGDHSKLWPIEKLVSVALLGVVPATFMYPNLVMDDIFAALVVAHFYWGLEACVVDYVRPAILGPVLPKLALVLLFLVSAFTLGGLIYYNHTCIGIGCTGRRIWAIKN